MSYTLIGPVTNSKIASPLLKYASNTYSQSGEDGILDEIFRRLGISTGTFLEFGAWDGLKYSNCAKLARQRNWSGLFIEGNEVRFKDLCANYAQYPNVVCVNRWVDFDGDSSIDSLSSTLGPVDCLDLLSIDIDGNDFHVLASMQLRPRVIVVEFNPSVPNDVFFVQERNFDVFQGSSLLAFNSLLTKMGYELCCCTSANAFFIFASDFPKLGLEKFSSLDEAYTPKCNGRIFHGFDGTIYTTGMERLIWHGRKVEPLDLQLLSKSDRNFDT